MHIYANAGAKMRRGWCVGMVMGERGGTVVGAGDGRGRAICSWEGIGIYRDLSEFTGGNRMGSDKL